MIRIDIIDDAGAHWLPSEEQCRTWLQCALSQSGRLPDTKDYELSLRLVDEHEIARLNREYRHKDGATNVLSFPSEFPDSVVTEMQFSHLGDIAICPAVLEREAAEQLKEPVAHWAHLLIHGLLHLLGYDHKEESQASDMETLEIETLKMLGFPNPYLVG
jgi:probable rRNA maturation factor